ncbi:unnamed protein product [Cuscuta epithymum]|uniref:Uncharacterized protein n=1 Tax=Cuscuta epithymum TaxID=186058 RepID=A0AAV0EGL0_9ASTE|nr:unnamed protein product [Cuscuta epithymum]
MLLSFTPSIPPLRIPRRLQGVKHAIVSFFFSIIAAWALLKLYYLLKLMEVGSNGEARFNYSFWER